MHRRWTWLPLNFKPKTLHSVFSSASTASCNCSLPSIGTEFVLVLVNTSYEVLVLRTPRSTRSLQPLRHAKDKYYVSSKFLSGVVHCRIFAAQFFPSSPICILTSPIVRTATGGAPGTAWHGRPAACHSTFHGKQRGIVIKDTARILRKALQANGRVNQNDRRGYEE